MRLHKPATERPASALFARSENFMA